MVEHISFTDLRMCQINLYQKGQHFCVSHFVHIIERVTSKGTKTGWCLRKMHKWGWVCFLVFPGSPLSGLLLLAVSVTKVFLLSLSDSVGSEPPRLPPRGKSDILTKREMAQAVLLCDAQGQPPPAFRWGLFCLLQSTSTRHHRFSMRANFKGSEPCLGHKSNGYNKIHIYALFWICFYVTSSVNRSISISTRDKVWKWIFLQLMCYTKWI